MTPQQYVTRTPDTAFPMPLPAGPGWLARRQPSPDLAYLLKDRIGDLRPGL